MIKVILIIIAYILFSVMTAIGLCVWVYHKYGELTGQDYEIGVMIGLMFPLIIPTIIILIIVKYGVLSIIKGVTKMICKEGTEDDEWSE